MVERGERGPQGDPGARGDHGQPGEHGRPGQQGERGPTNRLALIGYLILSVAVAFAIGSNRKDIDKVCETVQRQLDRNAATVERGLTGLRMIRDDPGAARVANVPGTDYYLERPNELAAAVNRSESELKTYRVNAC